MAGDTDNRNVNRYGLWAVFAATAAVRIGFGAITPSLPLYARDHGLTPAFIALMTNAFMISQVLFQGYAGQLGDRWGRRRVMLAGTWLYTVAASLFVFDAGRWYYVALRGLEGLGSCAFGPTARAFVADLVPEAERGRAFGNLTAYDLAGILFGPMLGGVADHLAGPKAPFVLCAVLGLLAGVPLLMLTRGHHSAAESVQRQGVPQGELSNWHILRSRSFWAVALPGVGLAYLGGLYNVAWSLYMDRIGASPWQISLSFTCFALPVVALTVPFGYLADRWGRPLLIGIGGVLSTLATVGYGLFPFPVILIALSVLDGTASALFQPASQAFMADVAPSNMRGRFMGLIGASSTAATMVAVELVGYLYERVAPIWMFIIGGISLLFGCGSAVWIMLRNTPEDLRAALEPK